MCGIVGIISQKAVAADLYESLIHLQHRGQDSAGIITCNKTIHKACGFGLAREVFAIKDIAKLEGRVGLGHNRYATAGNPSNQEEIQPFWINSPYGIAIAHNGNLINQQQLNDELQRKRHRHLNTASDSEILLNLFADGFESTKHTTGSVDFFEQICSAVKTLHDLIDGAYSVVSMIVDKGLIAFRDPYGIRPLVYGRKANANGKYDYIFASEPTMFHYLGFTEVGDVEPGEVIFIDMEGNLQQRILTKKTFSPCIFEYVYFARPDSKLDDISVYRARLRMGQNLALNWKKTFPEVLPDIVIPVPLTSNTAALSFAHELGVRYSEGLYKNPFIGRTFIMPTNAARERSVRHKLSPQETEIRGKKVLVLDDSIVRGTTSKEIVKMLFDTGAKEVYFVSTAPPIKFPCFYGIDIPTNIELIAADKTINEIQKYLGVNRLLYQTETDLVEAVTRKGNHHIEQPCLACFNCQYPTGKISTATLAEIQCKRNQERTKV
jgi:amidophosphoribosyltransferase